jgi:Mitochondrial pyruvate carriers
MLTAPAHATDFWGPASNFGIPIAAVLDTQKDPEMYVPSHPNATASYSHVPTLIASRANSLQP